MVGSTYQLIYQIFHKASILTPRQAKAFIKKQLRRWSYLVTSYGWKFDVHWCINGHEMPPDHEDSYGSTFTQSQYLEGDIYFNLHECATLDENKLEEVVIHEITHMILAPMQRDNNQDNTELCTTMVSRLFKGLRS